MRPDPCKPRYFRNASPHRMDDKSREIQIECPGDSASLKENEFSSVQSQIFQLEVDENPRNSDGLILHGWEGATPLRAFFSSRVMDNWAGPRRTAKNGKCLFREGYNELGKRNLSAIERIVVRKYRRGLAFNHQHPFVDVLLSAKCLTSAKRGNRVYRSSPLHSTRQRRNYHVLQIHRRSER